MKWQSEEHVGLQEAAEWARHFGSLENDMDRLLADLLNVDPEVLGSWISPGRYVSGREFSEAGLAELITLEQIMGKSSATKNAATPPNGNGVSQSVADARVPTTS